LRFTGRFASTRLISKKVYDIEAEDEAVAAMKKLIELGIKGCL
jgi:hypothetical protein